MSLTLDNLNSVSLPPLPLQPISACLMETMTPQFKCVLHLSTWPHSDKQLLNAMVTHHAISLSNLHSCCGTRLTPITNIATPLQPPSSSKLVVSSLIQLLTHVKSLVSTLVASPFSFHSSLLSSLITSHLCTRTPMLNGMWRLWLLVITHVNLIFPKLCGTSSSMSTTTPSKARLRSLRSETTYSTP